MNNYYDFVEDSLKRIQKGIHFDIDYTPYDVDFIDRMIDFYVDCEEYEKCQYLLDFKTKRFSHSYGYKNYKVA